jgi:SAM-dependent methyltransferase
MKSMTLRNTGCFILVVTGLTLSLASNRTLATEETRPAAVARTPDVVYVPTPQPVVEKMLEMAEVKKGDVVYDLGCGDGRIVVTAAKKYGVKAIGFDIDPQRVKEARENVKSNKVEHLVTIKQEDIFTLDLREANVVTLYLLPELNVRLMPQLAKLKPGSRIVSHDFDMRGAKPVQVHEMTTADTSDDESYGGSHTIYKWVVPWKPENAETASGAKTSTGANALPPSPNP